MTVSNFNDVGEFYRKFGLHNVTYDGPGPTYVGDEDGYEHMIDFRVDFIQEELDEFVAAVAKCDDAEMFDALLDLAYVAMGTAHLLGYPWEAGWDRVHEANMRKERATSEDMSSRRSTLDIVKPDGWQPPDIEGLLAEYGF